MKKRREPLTWDAALAAVASWINQRVDCRPLVALAAKKTVPIHRHSWIYLLGGALVFLFAVQVATGCLLLLYYQPSETTAHESVRQIMTQVPYGWLVRSIHATSASFFIATAGLHFLTVLFSRAYRKPRELTWLSGIAMLFLALGFGFSGYLLPWNELAYYATLVGTKIPGAIPLVGDALVWFLRGGEDVTAATLNRFFAFHVAFLPLAFGLLVAGHLTLIQVQGMSIPLSVAEKDVRDRRPFFSEFLLTEFCVWLLLGGVLVTLAIVWPAEVGQKADLLKPAPEGIKPEWYFLFMFKTLKLVPETLGVALFALGALFLAALPFVDRKALRGQRSRGVTAAFVLLLLYVAVFETLALMDPGGHQPAEELIAETYSLSGNLGILIPLWGVIGGLIFYLRLLAAENRRVRRLYPASDDVP